jgi:hypothetical protein
VAATVVATWWGRRRRPWRLDAVGATPRIRCVCLCRGLYILHGLWCDGVFDRSIVSLGKKSQVKDKIKTQQEAKQQKKQLKEAAIKEKQAAREKKKQLKEAAMKEKQAAREKKKQLKHGGEESAAEKEARKEKRLARLEAREEEALQACKERIRKNQEKAPAAWWSKANRLVAKEDEAGSASSCSQAKKDYY